MIIPNDVKTVIDTIKAGTGISERVLFAWMICEDNGIETKFPDNNNPLNIRYLGNAHPWTSGRPWFNGTNGIQGNLVVTYESPEAFAAAVVALLTGLRDYYGTILDAAASGDENATAEAIEKSPWDGAHYDRQGDAPGNIVKLLQSLMIEQPAPQVVEAAAAPAPAAEQPQHDIHYFKDQVAAAMSNLYGVMDDVGKAVVHTQMQAIRSFLAEHYNDSSFLDQ